VLVRDQKGVGLEEEVMDTQLSDSLGARGVWISKCVISILIHCSAG
jgi:hypothetical protein